MTKILSLNNYKGGSAKTFTSINVAVGLANKGHKVLLIDNDPQGNASYKFFPNFEDLDGLNEVIFEKVDINDVIYKTKINNLYMITSKSDLKFGADRLESNTEREFLKIQLKKINQKYNYIIFDNNPYLDIFLKNCTFCCDWIIIPVNVDLNSMKGVDFTVDEIIKTINSTSMDLNVQYKILLTKVGKTKVSKEYIEAVREKYKNDIILDSTIRYQQKPSELQTTDDDYFAIYDSKTSIGQDYQNLVNEIERKL